jgi:hypothetical protein
MMLQSRTAFRSMLRKPSKFGRKGQNRPFQNWSQSLTEFQATAAYMVLSSTMARQPAAGPRWGFNYKTSAAIRLRILTKTLRRSTHLRSIKLAARYGLVSSHPKVISSFDADYNAIEARGIAWLAGAEKLLDIYHRKGDPYCEMATVIYGKKINKDDHPAERFVGKQVVLGAGYGLGPPKFEAMCAHFGQPVSQAISIKAVKAYRSEFAEIPECWYDIQGAAIKAVDHKGRTFTACNGKIAFRVKGRLFANASAERAAFILQKPPCAIC